MLVLYVVIGKWSRFVASGDQERVSFPFDRRAEVHLDRKNEKKIEQLRRLDADRALRFSIV